MPELKIEITEALDHELKEMADAQLVTKEDIARGTLARCVTNAKRQKEHKPSFFGLDLAMVGQTLTAVGSQLVAMAQGKEEAPPE